MEVLKQVDDELVTKLVRLAGGNGGIVMQVLSRARSTPTVDLDQVVTEIVAARKAQAPAPQ